MEKIKSTLILCYGYVAMYAPKELVLSRIEADILKNIFQYFNTKVRRWDAPASLGRGEQTWASWSSQAVVDALPHGSCWDPRAAPGRSCRVGSLVHR